jgi:putative protease
MVHFRGHTTDFYQRVDHMEVDHAAVQAARAGQVIGLQVSQRVRENDVVSKVAR